MVNALTACISKATLNLLSYDQIMNFLSGAAEAGESDALEEDGSGEDDVR